MKIGLIGYGKMGKSVEQIAIDRNHEITCIVDQNTEESLEKLNEKKVAVAVEFTQPDAAFDNISFCLKNQIPVISGTTGWLHRIHEIHQICHEFNGTFLHATNFSVGVNVFFKLNAWLASVMGQQAAYNISIEETHHTQKLDKPSGTAITLAEHIIQHHPQYDRHVLGINPKHKELAIESIRKDDVPGTHVVKYDSSIDTIELIHTAKNRTGFALGAVLVAEWIKNKKGVYTFDDFLKI